MSDDRRDQRSLAPALREIAARDGSPAHLVRQDGSFARMRRLQALGDLRA